ncbi:MAG: hypothetical protein QNJ55_25770 [Xenococcus sp. MO_188.B8]|nr:hypothetical protein [Xenococcus sp. MO_188.B8]
MEKSLQDYINLIISNNQPKKPRPLVSPYYDNLYKNTTQYAIHASHKVNNSPQTQPTRYQRPLVSESYESTYSSENVRRNMREVHEIYRQIHQADNKAAQRRFEAGTRTILNQELEFYCNICHIGYSSIYNPHPCPKCGRLFHSQGMTQYPF